MAAKKIVKPAKKNKGGRPKEPVASKVDFKQLTLLCAKGFTDQELAEFYKVNRSTIHRWKADKQFLQHQKSGKELSDNKVVRSLYERACGYSHQAVKMFVHEGKVITKDYTEHYPPDTTAAIFWLKNRQPDDWRDRHEMKNTGEMVIKIEREGSNPKT